MIFLKVLSSILLIGLLTMIALLHFYWAAGGKRFSEGVIPEFEHIELKQPGPIPTIIVGIGLMIMAMVIAWNMGWLNLGSDWNQWAVAAQWVIAVIFLLRSIGEFRYIGLFKTKKDSLFAQKDSKYYSPLCLVMGILAVLGLIL